MIVLDIESSGGDWNKHGVWQIGAIDFETGEEFIEEARIDEGDQVSPEALIICGKTEEELRDSSKQNQEQLIKNFLEWLSKFSNRDLLCHNPQFDQSFLKTKSSKYFNKDPFFEDRTHRAFDLHSIAQIKFYEINKNFLLKDHHSDMGLREILNFCGIFDKRVSLEKNSGGTPHNALEDCRLTAECFSRLVYGKNLLKEFSKFEIPNYLKQEEMK